MVEIDLAKEVLSSFVHAGDNVPEENRTAKVTGFNNPDNLAKGPDGRLWIVEDNVPSDIWVAGLDNDHDGQADSVELPRVCQGPGGRDLRHLLRQGPEDAVHQRPTPRQGTGRWHLEDQQPLNLTAWKGPGTPRGCRGPSVSDRPGQRSQGRGS